MKLLAILTALMLIICLPCNAQIVDNLYSTTNLTATLHTSVTANGDGTVSMQRTASEDAVVDWYLSSPIKFRNYNDRVEIKPVDPIGSGQYAIWIIFLNSSKQFIAELQWKAYSDDIDTQVLTSVARLAGDNNVTNVGYYSVRFRLNGNVGDGFKFDEIKVLDGPGYWADTPLTTAAEKIVLSHAMTGFRTANHSSNWAGWNYSNSYVTHNPENLDSNGKPDIASVYYPSVGYYDMTDDDLVEYQCQLLKMAGIGGMIFDLIFYDIGSETVSMMSNYLSIMSEYGLKAVICYEDKAHWVWDPSTTTRQRAVELAYDDMNNWLNLFINSSRQYCVSDNRPLFLFFSYETDVAGKGLSRLSTDELTTWLNTFPADSRPVICRQYFKNPEYVGVLNGSYSWISLASPSPPELAPYVAYSDMDYHQSFLYSVRESGQNLLNNGLADFHIPGVWSGFDDLAVWGWGSGPRLAPRFDGQVYDLTWDWAIDDNLPVVQIVTWNDWFEATVIEPSVELGNLYIEKTFEKIRQFKGLSPSPMPDFNVPIWIYKIRDTTINPQILADMDSAADMIKAGQYGQAKALVEPWALALRIDSVTYWTGPGSVTGGADINVATAELIGNFEKSGSPVYINTFAYQGQADLVRAGQSQEPFGQIPDATQGRDVYAINWTDDGGDNTVEVSCSFAVPPGYNLTDSQKLLVDVYASESTTTNLGLGIWFSNIGYWQPEADPIGVLNTWVTMQVQCENLSGIDNGYLNLGFKRTGETGLIFVDNLRMLHHYSDSPAEHLFGDIKVGESAELNIIIKNSGDEALEFIDPNAVSIITGQADFSISEPFSIDAIAADETRDIVIKFEPKTIGSKTATLQIKTNDIDTAVLDITITGSASAKDGDLNVDGQVNMLDLALLANQWQNGYSYPELLKLAENWLN